MDPLLRQLRELPARLAALSGGKKLGLAAAVCGALLLGLLVPMLTGAADGWQYVFTNLTPEDSAEAASRLKAAGIPFRPEAQGAALAVPASKVYDARLLLASAGIPRGGGVGFELFDRGDLGVSEFTQKVNLRRAIEGELARTIGRLASVRTARVHVTLAEKGLYRDDDRKASAAVVVSLQPGRTLDERELAGIRHLVASAVPGLAPDSVTVVDGRGTVLAVTDGPAEAATSYQRTLERDLEKRIVDMLEPVVGAGAVVARVSATVDASEVTSTADVVDPDASALRSERSLTQTQASSAPGVGGVAGAAANQPLSPTGAQASAGNQSSANVNDQVRNYDVSKTTTVTVQRTPRLRRLSAAVLLDGVDGKPRAGAEVTRLGELARRAIGFDLVRGDQLDISSSPFSHSEEPAAPARPGSTRPPLSWIAAGAGGLLLLLAIIALLLLRRRPTALQAQPVLRPGARVSELEAGPAPLPASLNRPTALPDPDAALRDRARDLAGRDPSRAAHLVRAWLSADADASPEVNRG